MHLFLGLPSDSGGLHFFLKVLGVGKEIMALLNNFIQNSRFAGRLILTLVKIGPKIAVSVMKYIIP